MNSRLLYSLLPVLLLLACKDGAKEFARDVAPIVYNNCTPCHRPGGGAPFSLVSYYDLRKRAQTIEKVIAERIMPPWPADPEYVHFAGERFLSAEEKETILTWIREGAVAGDTSQLPPVPNFKAHGSDFRPPDKVVKLSVPLVIPGDRKDHFQLMRLPFEAPPGKFLEHIAIVPGKGRYLHHLNAHLLNYDPALKRELFTGREWVPLIDFEDSRVLHQELGLPQDDGSYPLMTPSVANYLPGMEPFRYPHGLGGFPLSTKNALYLNSVHYGPSAKTRTDSFEFQLWFTDKPPVRPLGELILGTLSTGGNAPVEPVLEIPAGTVRSFSTQLRIREDISLLSVNPHMHLLGKAFKAFAIQPNGDTIRIISIPRWDFRWQYNYVFPRLLKIPAGSVIYAYGTFDNTSANPNNPNHPPQTVGERNGSMRTSDEMFQLILTFVKYRGGDEQLELGKAKGLLP